MKRKPWWRKLSIEARITAIIGVTGLIVTIFVAFVPIIFSNDQIQTQPLLITFATTTSLSPTTSTPTDSPKTTASTTADAGTEQPDQTPRSISTNTPTPTPTLPTPTAVRITDDSQVKIVDIGLNDIISVVDLTVIHLVFR